MSQFRAIRRYKSHVHHVNLKVLKYKTTKKKSKKHCVIIAHALCILKYKSSHCRKKSEIMIYCINEYWWLIVFAKWLTNKCINMKNKGTGTSYIQVTKYVQEFYLLIGSSSCHFDTLTQPILRHN